MKKPRYVGVIGAGSCDNAVYDLAWNLGLEIGKRKWVLVCGGLGGVMEGAAKGALEAGGMTIGILPGLDKESANSFIQIPLPTGLGDARNLLIVHISDVLVSIAGEYGTLSEIALTLKAKKPVIGLETWEGIRGVQYVSDYQSAIKTVQKFLDKSA